MSETTNSPLTIATPVKPARGGRPRSPLAATIAKQVETKSELFSDPLMSLTEFRLAAGGMSYSHVRRLIADGKISVWRPYKTAHQKIRLSEIRRFLASGVNNG
jgi:hypothetical protein